MADRKRFIWLGAYIGILGILAFLGSIVSWDAISNGLHRSHALGDVEYYQLPMMNIEMSTSHQRLGRSQVGLDLEIDTKDMDLAVSYTPRIIDRVQTFMQRIPEEDLRELPNTRWLTRDLLWEINLVSGPVRIKDVTFRELVLPQ